MFLIEAMAQGRDNSLRDALLAARNILAECSNQLAPESDNGGFQVLNDLSAREERAVQNFRYMYCLFSEGRITYSTFY